VADRGRDRPPARRSSPARSHERSNRRRHGAGVARQTAGAIPPRARRLGAVRSTERGKLHRRVGPQTQRLVRGRADGGTLFLDEIGELPLAATGPACCACSRTGCSSASAAARSLSVDVRVVTGDASRDPRCDGCAPGQFREGPLVSPSNVFVIRLPPLREAQGATIAALAAHFRPARGRASASCPATSPCSRLTTGPGNVRELSAVIERACDPRREDAPRRPLRALGVRPCAGVPRAEPSGFANASTRQCACHIEAAARALQRSHSRATQGAARGLLALPSQHTPLADGQARRGTPPSSGDVRAPFSSRDARDKRARPWTSMA